MDTLTIHCSPTSWERFRAHFLGISGFYLLCLLIVVMGLGAYFTPYGYDEIHLTAKNQAPSLRYWFGTDDLGRDIFTRTCFGANISFCIALATACIDLTLGILVGSLAGLSGSKVDECIMRFLDILYSIPTLLTAILLSVFLGSGLISIVIAVNVISWITMARIVRGQILLLREMDFILAARSLGATSWHILFYHLLPNTWGPIMVTLTMTIPSAIFSEAFLSFLGLGIQAPLASWGTMAYEGLPALQYYPWRLFFPAAFISTTMLSFYLIGEGLKHTFNNSYTVNLS